MTDVKKLDKDFQALAKMKNTLADLDYNDEKYDDVEEKLHDLEDAFLENYGEFLEGVLESVHDEYCPDSDVLLPIAYMANKYIVTEDNQYQVSPKDGVFVEADDYPGNVRLVMIPNPTRFVLNINGKMGEVVWPGKA
ncbi:MAG: hypothetical protein OEX02_12630 [Cyclobacteriaceae bacterium]|nr:hypothetical protein [Cyclobacteriaceae bacterium]